MIQTTFQPERVVILAVPETQFCELSFAVEQGLNWFFGRGISAFKIERAGKEQNSYLFNLSALSPSQALKFSQVSQLGVLAQSGYWPADIPFDKIWKVPGDRKQVRDGFHRVFSASKEGTLINQYGIRPEATIGDLAYGLSDLIVGFFWLGAKWIKHQSSIGKVQTEMDLGFEGDELQRYLLDAQEGYPVNQSIKTMEKS